ncbi:FecR family protein [Paraflavitalea soli]|uniref:FecR family protein n=1 Tax=Paraflavitalea soli TaxID=2315862 RepID=A0A3B7MJZ3_9BACT|nr:FecR family protein [Paraflavitalea soli]AXY74772.1 FecR family protein [Paraflavitalea soli]
MKSHQPDLLLLIYFKLKEGIELAPDEQLAWEEYRTAHPVNEETLFDEDAFTKLARYQRQMLPWQQFREKYDTAFPIAFPVEKQQPTVQTVPSPHRYRLLTVAASLLLLAMTVWWFWPADSSKPKPIVQTENLLPVEPGYARAMLTLSDNQGIALDTIVQRTLPEQGNAVVTVPERGWLTYTYNSAAGATGKEVLYNRLKTPVGGYYQLKLTDGTKVWLNASSELLYPAVFGEGPRTVELTGEAYFEVAKDPAKPFKVKYNGNLIKVLGTHFMVNAYKKDSSYTALAEGKIRVSRGEEQYVLRPGQRALTYKEKLTVSAVDIRDVMALKNKYFSFHNTRLSEILEQVKRWYDVEIIYMDFIDDEKFVIEEFPRNYPLKDLLENLESTGLIHFEQRGRKVYVTR